MFSINPLIDPAHQIEELNKELSSVIENIIKINKISIEMSQNSFQPIKTDVKIKTDKAGKIVWARLNKLSWPAAIIGKDYDLCGVSGPRPGYVWVFWFGDNRVSEVQWTKITDFEIGFKENIKLGNRNEKWKKGIIRAIKELASRYGLSSDAWDDEHCLRWASDGFSPPNVQQEMQFRNRRFSDYLLEKFAKIKESQEENADSDEFTDEQINAQDGIKNRNVNVNEICLRCYTKVDVDVHPLFFGKLCFGCREKIRTTMYAYGTDGIAFYCCVCGRSGDLICCDSTECGRSFCSICIETFCTKGASVLILKQNIWKCFICSIYDPKINGNLVKRDDWTFQVQRLFHTKIKTNVFQTVPEVKSGIRVLSLFDGIGTGYLILKQLNIKIDKYFASEIDKNCMVVTRVNHGNHIIQIGDVKDIDEDKIEHLLPIDLILAASPCNDLSLANPQRKGIFDFSGSGVLFFEFFRILKIVERKTTDRPLFWIFENVSSMKCETRDTINRFLNCEPVLLDAKTYSAQKRPRYFWGNIPGLDTVEHFDDNSPTLNDSLTQNSYRTATVEKIRTVTTNLASLKQADKEYPVYDIYGNGGTIWITELEEIFGFPRHYTDVSNFTCLQRHELLGKAWSIPVVTRIFKPLKLYFEEETD